MNRLILMQLTANQKNHSVYFCVAQSLQSVVCPRVTHEHFRNTVFLSSTVLHTSYLPCPLQPCANTYKIVLLICSYILKTSKSSFSTHYLYVLLHCYSPLLLSIPLSFPFLPGLTCSIVWGWLLFSGRLWWRVLQSEGEREKQVGRLNKNLNLTSLLSELEFQSTQISGISHLMCVELLHWTNQQLSKELQRQKVRSSFSLSLWILAVLCVASGSINIFGQAEKMTIMRLRKQTLTWTFKFLTNLIQLYANVELSKNLTWFRLPSSALVSNK